MERTITDDDVLPLELDDGTRMTCTSIAGGQKSTRGVPDFLYLTITQTKDPELAASESYRYTSELVPPPENPWPRFQPHPDDPTRCHVCGNPEGLHGTSVSHCPPFEIKPKSAPATDAIAADAARVVEAFVARLVSEADGDPDNLTSAQLQLVVDYLIVRNLQRLSSPSTSFLNAMASGAGGFLGSRMGLFPSAIRERHGDRAAPLARSRAEPAKKPAPRKSTGRKGRGAKR